MILLPEQKIKAIIDYALNNINDRYLYQLFGDLTFGDGSYQYFENASRLFQRADDNPRKVVCNFFFNKDRQGLPTIHIAMNSENIGEGNGLGFDPGDVFYDPELRCDQEWPTATRAYSSRYNIVFTSDNTFEVIILYNVIKAFVQGNYAMFELNGLRNVKISGGDILLNDYLVSPNIYSRSLVVDCLYEFTAPELNLKDSDSVRDIVFRAPCGKELNLNDEQI